MVHPPSGYVGEYRGENDMQYLARTNLAALASSANVCRFCAIIYQGAYNSKDDWIEQWAEHSWADTFSTGEEILTLYEDRPWLEQFKDEIEGRTSIGEPNVLVVLAFPKDGSLLSVRLQLPPWPPLVKAKPQRHESASPMNRSLAKLEFFAEAGIGIEGQNG